MPVNIIDVLTAAAPIVASVANIATSNKKSDTNQGIIPEKQQPNTTININITNHFYTNSNQDSIKVAKTVEDQVKNSVIESGIRYLL